MRIDSPTHLPHPRRLNFVERITSVQLRQVFTRNPLLKLFSLFLALLLWALVASQQRGETTEFKFSTPVVLKNIPADLVVTDTGVNSVSVLVSVERSLARSINPNQFQVALDLRNQIPGTFDYTLSEQDIAYNNIVNHEGVSVLQISPSQITLTLEEAIEKNVPIRAQYAGDVAPGFIIESIRVQPNTALVRGPRTELAELRSISTRALDVEGLNTDVEMQARLDLPPLVRLVKPEDGFFTASITMSTNSQRVLLRNIPVRFLHVRYAFKSSTTQVNAHLEGPKDVVDKLTAENVHAVLDLQSFAPGDYRGLTPRVVLPNAVKVLEQWPIVDLFILQRKVE